MILPTTKLNPENSLLYLGGVLLGLLIEPKTVSRVWEEFQKQRSRDFNLPSSDISFEWFILTLDLLYMLGAIRLKNETLRIMTAS